MGISVLIVDDDKLLVDKLEETLDWQGLGVSTVLTASNIRQAQALLREFSIQLLLCDIDMPQGSGLELLEWVREQKLPVECAFLSSYANFAYAQKALMLNSREYLLKPISNDELEKSLRKLVREIAQREPAADALPEKEEKQAFWQEFIFRGGDGAALLNDAMGKGLYGPDDKICMAVITKSKPAANFGYKKELSLFNHIIANLTMSFLEQRRQSPEAVIHTGDFERILLFRADGGTSALHASLADLASRYDSILPRQCCLYLSKARPFPHAALCQEKIEWIVSHSVLGDDAVVDEESWNPEQLGDIAPPWDTWAKEMAVAAGDARRHILDFFDAQANAGGWTSETLTRFCREFVQLLYQYLSDRGTRFGKLFDSEEFGNLENYAYTSLNGTREFIAYIFDKLEGSQSANHGKEHVVGQVKEYIEAHLREDLSRKLLAEKVFLSEVYLSKLFAQATGMSIPAYIASRRISKAKDFLEHSSMPVSKIAMEVGYSNFSYFSKSFRDIVGCSPNEYRSRVGK
ncbi:helix-turn-helix domain-containing protein [Ruminococcaceae bacterium OttesenSCG-928-L11]|nr:helix-turn-helix domain-containing protein [Ruminococcaceae bacterium OttesenSCG-928-L11]